MSPGPNRETSLSARRVPAALLALTLTVLPVASTPRAPANQPADQVPALLADDTADLRDLALLARADRNRRNAVTRLAQKPSPVVAPKVVAAKAPARVAPRPAPPQPRRTEGYPGPKAAGNLAVVISYALAQVGKPYRYGAAGPAAFDCSGLIQSAFARIGVRLPHSAAGIGRLGTYVPRSAWTPGTVLAYGGHVGLYLGNGRMVHASRAGQPVKVANVYGNPSGRRIG